MSNGVYYSQDVLGNRHNRLYDLILIALSTVLLLVYFWQGTRIMSYIVMAIYFFCVYVQFKEKRYGTFFFYLTFFLFLLGTVFFGLFDRELLYNFPDQETERHTMLCLGLAMIGVYIGSVVKWKRIVFGKPYRRIYETDGLVKQNASAKMRGFLRYAYFFTAVFEFINVLAKAVFVQANSYVAYYLDYQAPLPYFVLWFANVSSLFYYFYLGTKPSKKRAMLPTGIYLFIGIASLFFGQRNVFFVRAIIVLCYFFIRNKDASEGTVWITKKQIIFLIILLPFAILFMSLWDSIRSNRAYSQHSILDGIREALLTQGNCISILDYEHQFRSMLPDRPFAIGGIITMLRNNLVSRIIGIPSVPAKANTIETALNGYSFSCSLMYLQNRTGYLLGYGIGSCYIAELVNTFGYLGIVIGSVIYGAILNKLTRLSIRGFMTTGFALCMFQQLLLAPRSSFDSFITGTFQISYLFVAALCWFLSKKIWPAEAYE